MAVVYQVIIVAQKALYSVSNVAELRALLEHMVPLAQDQRPHNYERWSNSRCVTYYVQAGLALPYGGPDWFMGLRPAGSLSQEAAAPPDTQSFHAEYIQNDGSVSPDGWMRLVFWRERNHIRLGFEDRHVTLGEVFFTEESGRKLWVKLGQLLGFDAAVLSALLNYELPPACIYTPEIPPQRSSYQTSGFNIMDAINQLNIDFDLEDDEDSDSNKWGDL